MLHTRRHWVVTGLLLGAGCAAALGTARAQDQPPPAQPAAQPAPAPAPSGPAPGSWTFTGLLDLYYMYNFNHPPAGTVAGGRAFDVKNDSFSLSLLEVNVVRTAGKGVPLGVTATFTVGKTADIVHATEPGGTNTYKLLQQLFATYTSSSKVPVTIDFGKFVTWLGYEVIEAPSNDNYSRSFLFTFAIPFYHMGFRVTAPLTPQLTAGLYLVNGWNNVEDDNGGKTVGASLNWNPTKTINLIANYIGGDESQGAAILNPNPGAAGPTFLNLNVQLGDLVATWTPTSKLKLGANVDYASASKPGTFGGNWSGEAIYGKYQFTPANALAVRAEHFEDSAGLRTGVAQNLNEVTATLEHIWRTNFITRLEYRHDHAGSAFFPTHNGASHDQDTLTVAGMVKF